MSASEVTTLSTIGQIAITVRDVEKATAFYRYKLGLKFLFNAPPKMAFFQCGTISLMVGEGEGGDFRPSTTILYFDVVDIDASYATLLHREVPFVAAPHLVHKTADFELWMAFFKDPDENMFAIQSRKKP
ncbi:MAG TPA: VOC family protein [Thermoanaerobaculia bacterium]|nr:VOC family protein [Thermoanaerobaculia bacterium]